jgi:hypothetical protein
MAFKHTKKVDTESFIKARIRIRIRSQTSRSGSGSDQKVPDPTGSGYATLVSSTSIWMTGRRMHVSIYLTIFSEAPFLEMCVLGGNTYEHQC